MSSTRISILILCDRCNSAGAARNTCQAELDETGTDAAEIKLSLRRSLAARGWTWAFDDRDFCRECSAAVAK